MSKGISWWLFINIVLLNTVPVVYFCYTLYHGTVGMVPIRADYMNLKPTFDYYSFIGWSEVIQGGVKFMYDVSPWPLLQVLVQLKP